MRRLASIQPAMTLKPQALYETNLQGDPVTWRMPLLIGPSCFAPRTEGCWPKMDAPS